MADSKTEAKRSRTTTGEDILNRGHSSAAVGDAAHLLAKSIIDTVRTPMLVLDKNLRVLSANPSFFNTFYTTAAATMNLSLYDPGAFAWNTPELREMLEKTVSEKKEIRDFEIRQEVPHPGPRNLLLDAREIPGCGSGTEELILLSFEDVTDRVTAETFRRAKEKAEHATQAKNEFLASMSHEIRTPMTITLAALEQVLEMGLPQEQRRFLEMAMASSLSLLEIIDDILDLSRIEAGKLKFSESPFLIANLMESVIEIFAPKARMKGLSLSCDISPEMPQIVIGDQNRLRQVLVNLLGNAIKFTAKGEISLTVEPAGETGGGERQFISFSVRDTGIGIPMDRQGEVFQSFSQINSPEVLENGGSGLGLAICKRIVEQSGGEIGMESREGEGSVFFFRMPFGKPPGSCDARSPSEKPAGNRPERPQRPPRILVLEDEANIRELIAMLLKSKGWEVVTATSGEEGLAAWEKDRFDLILMDLLMPEMDGFEATRRIRQKEAPENRHVPIIALTAHVMNNDSGKCLEAGMDALLAKPFKSEEFLSEVERCLEREAGLPAS